MKRISLVLLIFVLACKNEVKGNKKEFTQIESVENQVKVSNTILVPNYPLWNLKNTLLSDKNTKYDIYDIFELERATGKEASYVLINNLSITNGRTYKATIIVKKGSKGDLFGFRLMGKYPNRVDAVFNLDEGVNKELVNIGGFSDSNVLIEHLTNDWYKCSVEAKVNSNEVKVIFGPTSEEVKTITWEAETKYQNNILILPSSLLLEELSN